MSRYRHARNMAISYFGLIAPSLYHAATPKISTDAPCLSVLTTTT